MIMVWKDSRSIRRTPRPFLLGEQSRLRKHSLRDSGFYLRTRCRYGFSRLSSSLNSIILRQTRKTSHPHGYRPRSQHFLPKTVAVRYTLDDWNTTNDDLAHHENFLAALPERFLFASLPIIEEAGGCSEGGERRREVVCRACRFEDVLVEGGGAPTFRPLLGDIPKHHPTDANVVRGQVCYRSGRWRWCDGTGR